MRAKLAVIRLLMPVSMIFLPCLLQKWIFSNSMSPIRQWKQIGHGVLSEHLKVCEFNQDKDKIIHTEKFQVMETYGRCRNKKDFNRYQAMDISTSYLNLLSFIISFKECARHFVLYWYYCTLCIDVDTFLPFSWYYNLVMSLFLTLCSTNSWLYITVCLPSDANCKIHQIFRYRSFMYLFSNNITEDFSRCWTWLSFLQFYACFVHTVIQKFIQTVHGVYFHIKAPLFNLAIFSIVSYFVYYATQEVLTLPKALKLRTLFILRLCNPYYGKSWYFHFELLQMLFWHTLCALIRDVYIWRWCWTVWSANK
jgi:hypothetical protein